MNEAAVILWTLVMQCSLAILLAVILHYFDRLYNEPYLKKWSASWWAFTVYILGSIAAVHLSGILPYTHPLPILNSLIGLSAGYLQIAWLLEGVYELASGRRVSGKVTRWCLIGSVALAIITTISFSYDPGLSSQRYFLRVGVRSLLAGLGFLVGAYGVFFIGRRNEKSLGRLLVRLSLLFYGLSHLQRFVGAVAGLFTPSPFFSYLPYIGFFDFTLQSIIGLGLVIWMLEEERAKVVRVSSALKESEDRLRTIFDSEPDCVKLLAADGTVLDMNPSGLKLLGADSRDQVIGKSAHDLVVPAHRGDFSNLVEGVFRGESRTLEFEILSLKGTRHWVQTHAVPLRDAQGDVTAVLALTRDVTDSKRVEEEIRRSETMSAVGQLVAGVAHEVRNPLFGISSLLDAFEVRFGVRPEFREYMNIFRSQVDRLRRLMQDLLDYSKPAQFQLGDHSIREVISWAVRSCEMDAKQKRVEIVSRVEEAPLMLVRIDPDRMRQVFQNLIENAIQHVPQQGEVRIDAKQVRTNGQIWVECVVEDSGCGFRPDDLNNVFTPFFTRRRGGTGLGLSIVQRIVEQHGGRISAANREGGGAAMIVRIPASGGNSVTN